MSPPWIAYLAANDVLWIAVLVLQWRTGRSSREMRRRVVVMGDEFEALGVLYADTTRMATSFVPPDQVEAWLDCVNIRLADFQAYVQRVRQGAVP